MYHGLSPRVWAAALATLAANVDHVIVVGDAMLDRYVYGRVERISPEAPIPVLAVEREVALPGGAAVSTAMAAGADRYSLAGAPLTTLMREIEGTVVVTH